MSLIVQATTTDLPEVMALTRDCVAAMEAAGIFQWDDIYPAEADFEKDIEHGTLWLIKKGSRVTACGTLDCNFDPAWKEIEWQHKDGTFAAVHRLMVAPSSHGRGMGRMFMNFFEGLAIQQKHSGVRLDTAMANHRAIFFYGHLGYEPAGVVTLRKGIFAVFEKRLALETRRWAAPVPGPLEGRFVTLTPMNVEADVAELHAASHGTELRESLLWRYLPLGPFPDVPSMAAGLREWQAKPNVIAYTVWDKSSGQRVGSISLMSIRAEHGVAELGFIWYAPKMQRTRTNTEACFLLLAQCFDELHYRRVEWKCNAANERSKAAAERLGFGFEGIFKQHMVVKGENRDTAWFAMMDTDWPRVRKAMIEWLGAEEPGRLVV